MSNRFGRRSREPVTAPPPLTRPPVTGMSVRMDELDAAVFGAVEAVSQRLLDAHDASNSLDGRNVLLTKSHMLLAMKATHRSIRRLLRRTQDDPDMAVDSFPLTRVQLERCFLALLVEDHPKRWNKRYQKNAWKTFAKKYFRDQRALGHLGPFKEYFGPSGTGITMLRGFARQMYVWEDEFQTLRVQIVGDEMDPRWEMRYIADMPTPAKAIGFLKDPKRKELASIVYPYYDSLSHFAHGGMAGVMQAAVLREDPGDASAPPEARERFWRSNIVEMTLPMSYVAQLLVATLFALQFQDDQLFGKLIDTWRPYHSDGSPLGVAVWDTWAAEALRTETGSEQSEKE